MSSPFELEKAYRYCEDLTKKHYENFPVASLFLPKKIRRAVFVVYAFARTADDIADEGNHSQKHRLLRLDRYWKALETLNQGFYLENPIFLALSDVLKTHPIPISLFFDLLHAFKQDILKSDYFNFEEIQAYCRYSANPVGRILLYLTQNATPENLIFSDHICTALQLINFLQDITSDLNHRSRCYIPQNEMKQFNVNLQDFRLQNETDNLQALIMFQLDRIDQFLQNGFPLSHSLKGWFGFEIRLIIQAALKIQALLRQRKNSFERPIFKKRYWPMLILRAGL